MTHEHHTHSDRGHEAKTFAKLRPLHDRILVERHKADEKTPGGIIIPDSAQEKATEATVVAVGSGKVLTDGSVLAPTVKVGDTVLLVSRYRGTEVEVEGKMLLVVREEDDLLAVKE